jgi:phenylpropionate dioxygenase-like ring-hydroxylating dioxygenase large terminal subunit
MNLPSGWYAFGSPREFSSKKPIAVQRFGLEMVVWRTKNGDWIAQEDRCPHRSAKLSLGWVSKNDCLTCPFHGFEFDPQGKCSFVPEIGRNAPGLKIQTWKLIERHGFLWIPWREPQTEGPNWFAELETENFSYGESSHVWKKHFSRCVENQLDFAHLPFVHRRTIGRGFDPKIQAGWELNDRSLRVNLRTGYFEFRFPNIWTLGISPRLHQTLMFVPVHETETRLYVRSYLAAPKILWLRQIAANISTFFNRFILAEDHDVVMSQSPGDVTLASGEHLFPSDRAIQFFRNWLKS